VGLQKRVLVMVPMQSCTFGPFLGISSGIFQLPMAMAAFGQAGLAPRHWVSMGELCKWKSNTLPLFLRGAGPLHAGPSSQGPHTSAHGVSAQLGSCDGHARQRCGNVATQQIRKKCFLDNLSRF